MLDENTTRCRSSPAKEALLQPTEEAACAKAKARLLFLDEIPQWQRDNDFLLSGYRPQTNSCIGSIRSVLDWHNETINIHSHLIAALVFLLLPFHFHFTFYRHVDNGRPIDAVLFFNYFVSVAICFVCSATHHVLNNHSRPVACLSNQLDYCGIVLLMWSASLASIHFAFICHPWLRALHWILVTLSSLGCLIAALHPNFGKPALRAVRAAMYASLGLFAVVFVFHSIHIYGFEDQKRRLSLSWMLLMAITNLIGAAFYAIRYPEVKYPYRFDILGASHQIFHIFIIVAGLVHYRGLTLAFLEVRGMSHVC